MGTSDDATWQQFVGEAFEAAGLPEVTESQLEAGTYTNAEIAEKFKNDPLRLVTLLVQVSNLGSPAEKRSILSFAVDTIDN